MNIIRDRRFWLVLLIAATIAAYFWGASRYPSLNDKAAMAGIAALEDPLGFTARLPLQADDGLVEKIGKTTWNWIHTNKKGMTFGVFFAAAFMTLFTLLRGRRFEGHLANSALGVAIGAPLGVCVNCAAPIARGMAAAGARLETTLATMISSPTLNVVVLTMAFSLFPLHIAVIKVLATLFFLLVAIPWLTRRVFVRDAANLAQARVIQANDDAWGRMLSRWNEGGSNAAPDAWVPAIGWVARHYALNLWFIIRTTVPLMLLAGFLGAVLVTLVPWDSLGAYVTGGDRLSNLFRLAAAAGIGILLPVPIGFDVTMAVALLAAGWPEHVVMVLLFTMGVFSVYSFMIVWQAVSLRVAAVLLVSLAVVGLLSGYAVRAVDKLWYGPQRIAPAFLLKQTPPPQSDPLLWPRASAPAGVPEAAPRLPAWQPVEGDFTPGIRVQRHAFRSAVGTPGSRFETLDVGGLGIDGRFQPSLILSLPEFLFEQSLAAGDVHGDGWPDLLLARGGRAVLYANQGDRGFRAQPVGETALADARVASAMFADLDGDGWLDILMVVRERGIYAAYNRGGAFHDGDVTRLPTPDDFVSGITAVADLDLDGDLDILVAPRWSGQFWVDRRALPDGTRPVVLWRDADGFRMGAPFGTSGVKLSVLITDLNDDGRPDLLMGNDYREPDEIWFNEPGAAGGVEFRRLDPARDGLAATTTFTMSIEAADIDNDLRQELYFGNVAKGTHSSHGRLPTVPGATACASLPEAGDRALCRRYVAATEAVDAVREKRDFRFCEALPSAGERRECLELAVMRLAGTQLDVTGVADRCSLLSGHYPDITRACPRMEANRAPRRAPEFPGFPEQVLNRNLLLARDADGGWVDRAKDLRVEVAGWTWNARFADLDNDGWQDLLVANGWQHAEKWESNLLFRNRGGRFDEVAADIGLADPMPTLNHVAVDLDRDGDLDVVTHGSQGLVRVYRNGVAGSGAGGGVAAIAFELQDTGPNPRGIGARIVVHHGERAQLRELRDSGGFQSQTPARAHFGLGADTAVDRIEVRWPDNRVSELRGPFAAGHVYRIARDAAR